MGKALAGVVTASALTAVMTIALSVAPQPVQAASALEEGKQLAFSSTKGNCLACHMITGAGMAGNIGPPLIAMKARYPDRDKLREQIWDATAKNANSLMPPFGKYRILTEDELEKVVDYIHSL